VAAIQAFGRQSVSAVEPASPSVPVSPTIESRSIVADSSGHEEENTAAQPAADLKRRRFTTVASDAFRKSIDGPQYNANEELSREQLRLLLTKTAATNVGVIVELFVESVNIVAIVYCLISKFFYFIFLCNCV